MTTYIAKEGERLDGIFFKHYGDYFIKSYESGFHAFILVNLHLINQVVLQGGEVVFLPEFLQENTDNEVIGIWE